MVFDDVSLNRRDTCHEYRVLCVVVLLVSFRAGKMNHIWFGSEECLPAEVQELPVVRQFVAWDILHAACSQPTLHWSQNVARRNLMKGENPN